MKLLNVSFGIFAFMPQGWLFMILVVLLEGALITRQLLSKWYDTAIYKPIAGSNFISGLVGFGISMLLNGGWYLVIWFPWVSDHEINLANEGALRFILIYYAAAFVLTLLIEGLINVLLLRKRFAVKRIVRATIVANIISYAIGSLLLYSYSFH